MFTGRKLELAKLEALYEEKGFQLPVIYGRRRVGKTALINRFIRDKDAIFFTGIESNARQNLENLSRSILSFAENSLENTVFPSFQAAFEFVFTLAEKRRIIFAIDEYPYVAKASKSLASTLQYLIDRNRETSQLFLILCGSSMSFMENHVLAYRAPLYGRRTAQFKILPFDFFESRQYFEKFSDQEMAMVYGMTGGTPQYLLQMREDQSLEENIIRCFLDPVSPLFEEPTNLLKQEMRDPAVYNGMIAAIAAGCGRLSEISSKTGGETSACAACIKNLMALGIVKKETPFGENSLRKTIYRIDDNLFRFWYRFIPDHMASIQRGFADAVYERIAPMFSEYMGPIFEEICKQYLWKLRGQGQIRIEFTDLGRWWGNDPRNRCEAEIDIMGTDGADGALFCECKWTNEKLDAGILRKLMDRSQLFTVQRKQVYLFAKRGFTKGCQEMADELGCVQLVGFDEMARFAPESP